MALVHCETWTADEVGTGLAWVALTDFEFRATKGCFGSIALISARSSYSRGTCGGHDTLAVDVEQRFDRKTVIL